jgi:hypothetical protein
MNGNESMAYRARRVLVPAVGLAAGVLAAFASIAVALLVTPSQPVFAAGQTVRVGAAGRRAAHRRRGGVPVHRDVRPQAGARGRHLRLPAAPVSHGARRTGGAAARLARRGGGDRRAGRFWFPLIAMLGAVYFLPTIIGSIRNVEGLGWLVLFNVFFPASGSWRA